ncbi:MAG: HEAT repeat domain-containing protein, partial [bacterium]
MEGADGAVPLPTPQPRTPDGLLESPALQDIVELQARGDADALVARLDSPEATERARAAFALASLPTAEAEDRLTSLLDDPDPVVRRDAAFALSRLQL